MNCKSLVHKDTKGTKKDNYNSRESAETPKTTTAFGFALSRLMPLQFLVNFVSLVDNRSSSRCGLVAQVGGQPALGLLSGEALAGGVVFHLV